MSINVVGGALGAVALTAILVFHGCERQPSPAMKPKPVAAAPVKSAPKPTVIPEKAQPAKAAPHVTYRRVVKGGKVDGSVTCKVVRSFVAGKSAAELKALQNEYQVSSTQLDQYKACLN